MVRETIVIHSFLSLHTHTLTLTHTHIHAHAHTYTHTHAHTHTFTDVAYKFEDLLQPTMEEREGDASDATLTYDQEDSELTVDYEQEEPVKEETKVEKESTLHPGPEEKEIKEVGSKKRKLKDNSEPPPSAKRTLSCAKKETAMTESQEDKQEKDGKETVDEGSVSVNVKSAGMAAASAKPSLEKKDSMEENLICQICQV